MLGLLGSAIPTSLNPNKNKMAIRYDQKKKDEVVAFILDYNKANGRGGQTVAAKKYGISPITIGAWLKKAGVKKAGGVARQKRPRRRRVPGADVAGVAARPPFLEPLRTCCRA